MDGYFDHNATTPMLAVARDEWLRVEELHWHNPSSLYREAAAAKRLLEDFREELADHLGCEEPRRVVFTSGATEANNAVLNYFASQSEIDGGVVVSSVEHPSVREAADRMGKELREVPVDAESGAVEIPVLAEMVGEQRPGLVSVMAANNETGVLQPWAEIAGLCRAEGVRYHCDAAQWLGKRSADGLGACDFVTGCAHKFGGPRGVGFLLVPEEEIRNFAIARGGPQERGLRGGTENLSGIAAMMAALRSHDDFLQSAAEDGKAGERDAFEKEVAVRVEGCRVVGAGGRLWNTSMLVVPDHRNLKWLTRLGRNGFAVSTGSACSAGKGNPSRVMAAMGLDYEEMGRVLRFSGGWQTRAEDWQALAESLTSVAAELASGRSGRAGGRGDALVFPSGS